MASVVSICNRALSKIGVEAVLSLDDGTKAASTCKNLYPDTRDALLRSYPWRFALKRYALAPMEEKPLFGFSYQFMLPVDCLRVWRTDGDIHYKAEGGKILADTSVFRFIGISRIEDPRLFDPMFIDVLALNLAYEAAVPLGQGGMKSMLYEEFQIAVQKARTASAMEGMQDAFVQKGWIESRW